MTTEARRQLSNAKARAYRARHKAQEAARARAWVADHPGYSTKYKKAKSMSRRKRGPVHVCHESRTCVCYILALEPDENCSVHGAGEWPPRCCVCGQFVRRSQPNP